MLTFYRQATDRLPTHYQQSADCRPTGSLYFGQNLSAWIEAKTLQLKDAQGKGRVEVQRSEEECSKEDDKTPIFQDVSFHWKPSDK